VGEQWAKRAFKRSRGEVDSGKKGTYVSSRFKGEIMKIFAYRIVQKGPRRLDEVLSLLSGLSFERRFFEGSAEGVRLEHFEKRGEFFFADIVAERSGHGPGRLRKTAPMAEFDMAEGEVFGEDTGLAFDAASGYLALQYNHVGPRVGRIQSYLLAADLSFGGLGPAAPGQSDWDRCGFEFGAVLRPDAYARLGRMGIVRKLEFTVNHPGAREADRDLGRSLSQVLNAPLPTGVETLEMTLKAAPQRNSRLDRNVVMGMIRGLQGLGGSLRKAQVEGRRPEDSSVEPIDLIEERLSKDALVSIGAGQRLPRQDRWGALGVALRAWLGSGALQVIE
jgi:hypothetical protein